MNKLIKPFAFIMAFTIPAIASADVEVNQIAEDEVRISYSAEEAATALGRAELERQIRRAAEKVCGAQGLSRAGSVRQFIENRNCYEKTVSDALKSITTTA